MSPSAQLATAFGIGRSPAPGTAASAVAILIAVPVMWFGGVIAMAVLTLVITAVGVWASDGYAVETGVVDPSECVIDEFAGQWLTCTVGGLAALPGDPALSWLGFVLAFLLFRLFDIAKPWPINRVEELRGGLGIMADDLVAGVIAGIVVFLFAFSGLI